MYKLIHKDTDYSSKTKRDTKESDKRKWAHTACGELTQNSQTCEKQNRENTHQKNNNNNHTYKTIFT